MQLYFFAQNLCNIIDLLISFSYPIKENIKNNDSSSIIFIGGYMELEGYKNSEDLLFSLLDCLDIGISIFDKNGKFLFVNRYNLKASGRSRNDFIGQTTKDFYEQGILNYPVAAEVVKTLSPASILQQALTKNGEIKEYLVRANPIFDGEGNMQYIVADRIEMPLVIAQYNKLKEMGSRHKSLKPREISQETIVSISMEMNKILDLAKRASLSDSTVLLQGETGVGKEVVANFIHTSSPRKSNPFIQINCTAMPENLLESELFGYEKGAFTGALTTGKTGLIESANHGTIFLDEINSMPLALQAKILRVLETKQVTKIGSQKSKYVDFRLICASNEELIDCVQDGRFRSDLFYRIGVVPLTIPPLRHRRKDIKALADHFLTTYCKKYSREKKLSESIYKRINDYDWPGNVRELKNFIEWIVVMTTSSSVQIDDLPKNMSLTKTKNQDIKVEENQNYDEKTQIINALKICTYHRQKTADYLGISRRSLQYKLKKYGLLET